MSLNGLSISQNAGKWHSESTKISNFLGGGMPPNPPSLVDANHSCKILDPPLISTPFLGQKTLINDKLLRLSMLLRLMLALLVKTRA